MTEKPFQMNKWILLALVVLCWALTASLTAGYYYYQYSDLSSKVKETIITANLGINYGNGTAIRWLNETKINAGSTLFDLTKLAASVNYTENLLGVSINAIDNVPNSDGKYWLWWSHSTYGWTFGQVASDRYVIGQNETVAWYREAYSTNPEPPS
jgi:hypothetical protein